MLNQQYQATSDSNSFKTFQRTGSLIEFVWNNNPTEIVCNNWNPDQMCAIIESLIKPVWKYNYLKPNQNCVD